jgi:hypothetical protein
MSKYRRRLHRTKRIQGDPEPLSVSTALLDCHGRFFEIIGSRNLTSLLNLSWNDPLFEFFANRFRPLGYEGG